LHVTLNKIEYFHNPVCDVISNGLTIVILNNKRKILDKFRFMYFILKYKNKFNKWYWKSQENKIKNLYSPDNLKLLLGDDDDDLEIMKLETW